jgi:hypothetical protein
MIPLAGQLINSKLFLSFLFSVKERGRKREHGFTVCGIYEVGW